MYISNDGFMYDVTCTYTDNYMLTFTQVDLDK